MYLVHDLVALIVVCFCLAIVLLVLFLFRDIFHTCPSLEGKIPRRLKIMGWKVGRNVWIVMICGVSQLWQLSESVALADVTQSLMQILNA